MSFECIRNIKEAKSGKAFADRKNLSGLLLALAFAAGPALSGPLGIDVDVSVDRGGVGVGADVGVGGGGGSVGVGADVGVNTGGGIGVGVGVGVDIGVDVGTPGVDVPGVGVPGVVVPGVGIAGSKVGGLSCAKNGNSTALNGFVVRDRGGNAVGVVHDALISPDQELVSVRLKSNSKACYLLSGSGLRIRRGEVWANVDSASFR